MIVAGALIAGLAVGVRTQTIWLTLPLLALVLLDRAGRGAAGALLGSAMTFSIGVLVWAIPLIVASGGLAQYRAAFAGQAAEQFTGLDIFLSNPTPAADGARHHRRAGWTRGRRRRSAGSSSPSRLAGLRCSSGARRSQPRCCSWRFVPYAIFHLIVQEAYSRYALPLVPAVGYLAVRGLSAWRRTATALGSAGDRRSRRWS